MLPSTATRTVLWCTKVAQPRSMNAQSQTLESEPLPPTTCPATAVAGTQITSSVAVVGRKRELFRNWEGKVEKRRCLERWPGGKGEGKVMFILKFS